MSDGIQVVVAGSLNADIVLAVDRMPRPGETLLSGQARIHPGGKGANQAYAAARMGARVSMIGRVGPDAFSSMLRDSLVNAGVDCTKVKTVPETTGLACIMVSASGENAILVAGGANRELDVTGVVTDLAGFNEQYILLCQLENPLASVQAALKTAKKNRAMTILDPAPARPLGKDLLELVDFLTPNEGEALTLLRESAASFGVAEAPAVASRLRALGAKNVILKMGANGCYVLAQQEDFAVAGMVVNSVDTTAAGDTFNGAFAAALASGEPLRQAVEFANAAAALSVTRHGAQPSVPSKDEVMELLAGKR